MAADRPSVAPSLPPWWLEEAPPDPEAPPLEGEVEADVAIVGGGYTGLWTALALRERDPSARVVVVEAAFSGAGPSGRNGGFLHGYWSALPRLRRLIGSEGALEVARACDGALAAVRALDDDVWLREGGLLEVATTPGQESDLGRSVAVAAQLGVPDEAVLLSAEEVEKRCRSPRFRAGVFYRDGATVHPGRLVRAVRRAVVAAGVTVYDRSPAIRVRPGVVELARGRVRAEQIVVATNAWMTSWRPAARSLTNFGSYVVLTEPVPELLAEIGWTGGESIFDGRMFLHYFRTTEDGRVVMGSGSGPIGFGGRVDARFSEDAATTARAEAGLRLLLPALAGARIERAWGGPIDVSADHFPFFKSTAEERIHYGAGYSGNGVGPSWLGGQVLASLALARDDEWTNLGFVRRRVPRLPPEPIRRIGGGLVRAAILRVEDEEEAGRRAPAHVRAGAAIPRVLRMRVGTR